MMRTIVTLCLVGIIGACGSDTDDTLTNSTRTALKNLGKKKAPVATFEEQRASVLAAAVALDGAQPLLVVELPKQGAVASLVIAGQNDGAVTWFDATGVSLVTRNGVVIATRGLGFDLMASDVSGTLSALNRGGAGYTRFNRYLDGEGQFADITFSCDATRSGSDVSETCSVPEGAFTNTYKVRSGSAVSSRQWISREVGYATITRF